MVGDVVEILGKEDTHTVNKELESGSVTECMITNLQMCQQTIALYLTR